MHEIPINWLAVLVAAVVAMIIGGLWYSPIMFGPRWMRLARRSPEQVRANMPKALAVDFIGMLIMAFVLLHAVRYAGAQGIGQGAAVGFFNWLGFVAVATFPLIVYEDRPLGLALINNGFFLIALIVMGAILAVWP